MSLRHRVVQVVSAVRSIALLGTALLGTVHCGSEEAGPTAATGTAPAPIRLVDEELSVRAEHPESTLIGKCVTADLPTDANGIPDCVLLVAEGVSEEPRTTLPRACERCDWPGQRVPSGATLARARLPSTETGCLCELVGQPPPPDGNLDHGAFGYCYQRAHGAAEATPIVRPCQAKAALGMRSGSFQPMPLTLTIACY